MSYSYYPYSTEQTGAPVYYPGGDYTYPHTSNGPLLPSHLPRGEVSVAHFSAVPLPPSGWNPVQPPCDQHYKDMRLPPQPHGRRGSQPYFHPLANSSSHTTNALGPVRSSHEKKAVQTICSSRRRSVAGKETVSKVSVATLRTDKRSATHLPGVRIPLTVKSLARFDDAGPMCNSIEFTQMTEDMQVQPFVHVSAIQQPSIGLLSPHDKVMGDMPDRRIRLRILWPGYSRYPQVKTIDTSKGQATRADMFHRTAYVVLDFFREMQVTKSYKNIDPGFEQWAIYRKPDGQRGIRVEDVVISSLVHMAGEGWQIELRAL